MLAVYGSDLLREKAMTELKKNHKRSLLIGFRYVDDLLSDIEKIMAKPMASQSPFPKYVADIAPAQQKIIAEEIAFMRGEMRRILEDKGIAIDHPKISSARAVRNAVHFADMAVEEMGPKYMKGYGELTEGGIQELDEIKLRMQKLLARIPDALTGDTETDTIKPDP